ncbi:MAG: MFS transporter [Candidatus Edwardsbacteria bacterium]|nr:MFS transporter [Candidatus Edwardsbacteria bacterium]
MNVTEKAYRRRVNAWCLYDWANSAYATTIMAAMLPPYFSRVAQAAGFTGAQASSLWGYVTAFTMLAVAFVSPALGAIADHTGSKKKFMFGFFLLAVVFTSLLALVGDRDWLLCVILFALSGIGNAGSNVFYDSLLPHVARPGEADRISARGYALGYLGGGLLLIVNLLMFTRPGWFGIPSESWGVRLSFLSVGLWWIIFSAPIFYLVREPPRSQSVGTAQNPIGAGLQRLGRTFREIRKYKQALLFLAAYWLYADGIGTIMKMATIYGAEIGIGMKDLVGALLLTQFIGVPCTFLFGRLAGIIGPKRSIMISLLVYVLVSIGGFFMTRPLHFWILAGTVGLVQGGSQALSRSLFSSMTPRERSAEFFGFFDVSSKFAGIAGPLIFSIVGQLTGTSRLSIVSLVIFFAAGMLILWRVNENEGIEVARTENLSAGQS